METRTERKLHRTVIKLGNCIAWRPTDLILVSPIHSLSWFCAMFINDDDSCNEAHAVCVFLAKEFIESLSSRRAARWWLKCGVYMDSTVNSRYCCLTTRSTFSRMESTVQFCKLTIPYESPSFLCWFILFCSSLTGRQSNLMGLPTAPRW
jgi:hypothetical protein